MASKIVKVLAVVWLVIAVGAIAIGYASILYFEGWTALQEIVSPFNLANDLAVVISLAPAALLLKLSDWLARRARTPSAQP